MPESVNTERTVLIVDDVAANRNLLRETLEPKGYETLLAANGTMALKAATAAQPSVILLDVNMPDMNGYEVCERLKADPTTAEIPVIFITANDDAQSLVRGFNAGGVDFVTKPFKSEEVLMRVDAHLRLHTLTQSLAERNAELEQEVARRQAAEAKAVQANEAKSRFLSFVSHEMRAPLNAIMGFGEELSETLTPETVEESKEDIERIRKAGGHLLTLINNLLDLSKIEAGKMGVTLESVDPQSLVRDLREAAEPLAKKNGNRLTFLNTTSESALRTDAGKLRHILLNLLSNAAKFTQEGTIECALSYDSDGAAQFTVTDTGIGMSPEEMAELFQPYQQANENIARDFGGTGLGLSISREFCRLLGGDLTVTSATGKGSTFVARLPNVAPQRT